MKNLFIFFTLILTLTAQSIFGHTNDGLSRIQIKGTLVGCTEVDTIYLYQWYGINMRQLHMTTLTEKKGVYNFTFKLANIPEGFYGIGTSPDDVKPLILGTEAKITVSGNCESIKAMKVSSPVNDYYQNLMKENGNVNNEFMRLLKQMRSAMRNPQLKMRLDSQFAALDVRRMALYEESKKTAPFLGKSQGLVTYLSYVNNKGDYKNEGEYFANEYFKYVDFSDESLQYTPALFQQMQSYATTIAQVGFDPEKQSEYVDAILKKTAPHSASYQAALLGTVIGYSKAKKDKTNFVKYGELFLAKYPDYDPKFRENVQKQINRSKSTIVGAVAPEISQQTPDGKTAKLSDLRGKVVLIDFWASWCGPCRRENPKVVALYDKYKDQGFEVFGVSLDGDKKRWLAAIEKDNLTWTHVSDLKKWKSGAAADYGVRSIPTTILIDQEGRILAKNLKGAALEAKIQQALK